MRLRLTPRDDRFFPMFVEAAQNLVSATELMGEFLHVTSNREKLAAQLREHEHAGDAVTHRVIHELNSTFVTPFDREDIYRLITQLDDVMDAIEAAADFTVLSELETLPAEMGRQVDLLQRAARCTAEAMGRLATMDDLALAHLACDEVCLLNKHQVAFGPTEATLTPELLRAAYGGQALELAGDSVIVAR